MSNIQKQGTPVPAASVVSDGANSPLVAVFDSVESIYLAHAGKLHDLSPYAFCQMFACMQRAKKETRRAVAFIEAHGLIEMFNRETQKD
ncbi:hypothetical protein [Alistipes communis]|uniref:hypothetical protein n=1 Tax=Alistipes communis TaxID=2585118 RepID=UPI00266F5AF4|nr:hypothetical protein [Alistipes communis]